MQDDDHITYINEYAWQQALRRLDQIIFLGVFVFLVLLFIGAGFLIYNDNIESDKEMAEWKSLNKQELKTWISDNHDARSLDEAINKYQYGNF